MTSKKFVRLAKQGRWFTEEHVRENGIPVTRIVQRGKLSESAERLRKEHEHIGFKKLENKVEREYERKGFSPKRAEYIGSAVAGKVARERRKKLVKA